MQNCKVIAVSNQKGGVGKTTTTLNLGIGLANNGCKVLLIDFDPQGDLTKSLGFKNYETMQQTTYTMIDDYINKREINYSELIRPHKEHVDLIASNINLAGLEGNLMGKMYREEQLRNCIAPIKENYDYILIDCPPTLGLLTINALAAADKVIIPVQAQYLPAKAMTSLLRTVSDIRRGINRDLEVSGILLTLADMRTNLAKSTINQIREQFGNSIKVFDSVIPVSTKAAEASLFGVSIYEHDKDCKAANAYLHLTNEVLNQGKQKQKDVYIR